MKEKNIITSIVNAFNRIYNFAIIMAIATFFFGGTVIAFYIFLYGGSFYLLSLCLKLIANEKKDKNLTYLGIFLTVIFTIITIFNVVMSVKWIGK